MLKSKELRQRAWESLKGKYWTAFLAVFVSGLIVSVSSYFVSLATSLTGVGDAVTQPGVEFDAIMAMGLMVILGAALVFVLVGFIIFVFVDSPLYVGLAKFFIKNTVEKPSVGEIFAGFKVNYGGNVKIMFLQTLKIALWSLLFVIPGIIKGFEYAMIPYILADNPGISSKDAFKKTKELMTGNKWRLFVLNLSFIGWILLSILTCGIGAFFLLPYMEAANAEFYKELIEKQ